MQTKIKNVMNPKDYFGEKVYLNVCSYPNGRTAIGLNTENGEHFAIATINIPDVSLNSDEVIIKNYSENEGMLKFLLDNNVVVDHGKKVYHGFALSPICQMLPPSEWKIKYIKT